MSLTYGLNNAQDLFEKLKRDAALLEEEVTSDRFFNFVVTGYSLIDWVSHDPSVAISGEKEIAKIKEVPVVKVCGDIANASKHFNLSRRKPTTKNVSSNQGWGVGRFGKCGWGKGEEQIEIELNDGSRIDGLHFVQQVVDIWQLFFNQIGG